MDTDLISSISKKYFILYLAVASSFGVTACSHSKPSKINSEVTDKVIKVSSTPNFPMGPTNTSEVFVDKTREYGLENLRAVHLYSVDLNKDGYSDLVILEDFYSVPKFYLFNPKLSKFELAKSPFDEVVRASFLNFVDLDHDGIYDVIVGSLNQKTEMTKYPPRVYRGELESGSIHFKKETDLPVGIMPTSSINLIDYDLDGELDLFITNWFDFKKENPTILPNILLKGQNFHFENVSYLLQGEYEINRTTKNYQNAAPTFGATICDVDQNGFPDILTNSSNGYFNKLWMNLDKSGEREFLDYGMSSGYAADDDGGHEVKGGGNSFFTACADYNNDKIIDLVVGNLFHDSDPESRDRSAILTGSTPNFPPKFIRSEFFQTDGKKSWSEGDKRGIFFDYNLDGLEDLAIENSGFPPDSRLIFFEQESDHAYDDVAAKLGVNIVNPSGVIAVDLNKDGLMDMIVGQTDVRSGENKNRIYVFENHIKRNGKGSVRFHLKGRQSNTQGISGSVYLQTNLHRYFRNVQYSYGSLPSQNEEGIYFAFDKEIPESVSVNWPLGIKDRLGRIVPVSKKYNLKKLKLKSSHHEYNLCEDGRILDFKMSCY